MLCFKDRPYSQWEMFCWMLFLTFCSCYLPSAVTDDYYWGSCPKVEPVPDFDFNKFSGLWYVIEKFDTSTPCWTFFFYNKNGTNKVLQTRNKNVDPLNPESSTGPIGTFETLNPASPGFMRVRFSDNIAGLSDYVVYYTDYTNYGAIFKCQKILSGNRQSVVILSRTPFLSLTQVNQARAKLVTFNINIRSLQKVDQSNCIYTPRATFESFNSTNMFGLNGADWQ